jgi:hypothetical protein
LHDAAVIILAGQSKADDFLFTLPSMSMVNYTERSVASAR